MDLLSCSSGSFAQLSAGILHSGTAIRFQASGASMRPLLRDGDTLLVVPVNARQVQVGDVLLFISDQGQALVHRVIRVHNENGELAFSIRGDRALASDGRITQEQVLGRVSQIERQGQVINTAALGMRLLGRMAVLKARLKIGHGKPFRAARAVLRALPIFYRYIG